MNDLTNLLLEKGIQLNSTQNGILSESQIATQVVPLIHQRVLAIKGPDTEKFLQGQLTCDVRDVFKRGSALGAHCNIKGHMLSLFRLMKAGEDEVWLRMHYDIFDSAVTNLNKYIIFSKATATDISEQVAGLGVTGPGAEALIEQLFDRAPSEDDGILSLSNGVVVRVPGNRFEIWMATEALTEIISKLPDEVAIGSTNAWLLSEIEAGIPDIRAETQGEFIPQMTNLQALNGVSFRKGCYTGQEIITRLQHRGQLKKPMYLAEASTSEQPMPGSKVNSLHKPNAGQIVLSAKVKEGHYKVLAVMLKTLAEQGDLQINGAPLILEELPYTLDPKLFQRK